MRFKTEIKPGTYVKFFVDYEKRFREKKIRKTEIAFGFIRSQKDENHYLVDIEGPESIKRKYNHLKVHKNNILKVYNFRKKFLIVSAPEF